MLRRLDEFLHRSSRAHDERGAAMPIVVMVVLVGFLVSSAIATTTLGSVRQTTHGRSNVQAFAAAEAGRDSMVAGISQAVPSCPSSTGTITGASWSVELFYVPGTTLPSGTTYAADGTPQPAAAWTPVTCDGLAAAAAGDYTVVVAATGVATIDGTTRVLDAVHPFHVEPPDNSIVGTVQGPFVLGSAGTGSVGTPAWSGGPLVISGPPGQTNFTCGGTLAQPTVVDADVYLLNGDAEFPGAGCHITGDLYVQRDISVSGRPSLGGVLGGDNRHLWVDGDIRVGRDFNQVWGGLTVGRGIMAGRHINLNGHEGLGGSEDSYGRVRVGTSLGAGQRALWAGGNVNLTTRDERLGCLGVHLSVDRGTINGRVQAVGTVKTHEYIETDSPYCRTDSGGGNWRISGNVSSGGSVTLKDTPAGGVTTGGALTATESSPISGTVTAGGAVTLTDSPVSGAVRTNGAVQATNSTITGKVTSLAQGVTLTNSGSGEIVAKGNVTTSGTVPITGPVSAGGNVVLTTNVSGDVAASGTINAANVMISGAVSSSATGSEFVVTLVDSVVGGTVQTSGAGVQATRVTLNGATTAGGRVSLTGPVTTKAISSTGRIDATGGGTLGGDLTTSTTATASPAVSITGMTVNGSVRANQLVRLLGRSTVNGSVESAGNVEQTGGRVTGRVLANGSYTGTPSTGIQVDKSVIAGGSVTIQNDTADNATLIGDGTADPSIWAGGKVTLRGTKEAMTTVRGKVTGHVRSTSSAPAIEVQRTWTVTGQLQASGAKATPETCGGEAICSEAQKLKDAAIPATPDVYGCRLKGTSLWYTSTYPTKAACEAAPWYDGKCLANCEWVVRTPGTPYVPPVYWPAAATGAGAAPTGTRPTAPTATVAVPAVTVTIPTSIAGVDIPPPVPEAPSENDLTGIDGGIVLDQGHWLDLGYEEVKAAAVESGYTNALTFSGTDCKRGWGGITDSKAERDIANALTQTGQKYLIDTTGCADPLTDVVALRRVNSDAVLLVKNYEVALSSFLATNGTPTSPRRIYVIQPDSQFDRDPTCNNNNAPGNTQAAEQTGRSRFKFSSSYGRDSIHTMYYSPCGMGGIGGNTNLTDIYGQVLIGASSSAEFVQFFCRPMALGSRPLFNLTCDLPQPASDVDGTGGVKSYLLGAATVQTEP